MELALALHDFAMAHRAGDRGADAALDVQRRYMLLPAQPGDPAAINHRAVRQGQFVMDEPVSERRVVDMDPEGGSGLVSATPAPLSNRYRLPGIEGLLGELLHA